MLYVYVFLYMYTKPGNNPSCSDMFKRTRMTFPPPQPPAPNYFSKVKMSVPIKDFHSAKVAERVAMLMMQKIKSGSSEASPMLVELLDESWRSIRDGKTSQNYGCSFYFMAVNYVFISLCCLLLTAFLFPRADFSFFQGAERTHAVVNKERATYLPQSAIKLYYFISCIFDQQIRHCFSKLSGAAQVVMFISVNEWQPPPTNSTNPCPFLSWADALRRKRPSSSLLKSKKGFNNLGKHEITMNT